MSKQYCKTCLQKPSCKTICPELEKHLKNDIEVPQREFPIDDFQYEDDSIFKMWPKKTTIESILLLFFVDHKTQTEIANTICKSQQYVSKVIRKYRPIIVENIKKSVVFFHK